MIKTLKQINREFMEEHKWIKMETSPDAICGDIEQKITDMETYLKSTNLKNLDTKKTYLKTELPMINLSENISSRLKQRTEQIKPQKKSNAIKKPKNIIFYIAIVFILSIMIIFYVNSNMTFSLFGYSGFTVLSESMQSEIPEGALILTKKVDPARINTGDDITFIRRKDNSIVTHRVLSIFENYGENNERGFKTHGIDNLSPDQDIVYADDIIGIVRLTIPGLGAVLNYILVNLGFFLVIFGGLSIIVIVTGNLLFPKKI